MGTVGALRLIENFGDPTLVLNADLLTDFDFTELMVAHQGNGALLTIATCRQHVDLAFGRLGFGRCLELTSFEEKPRYEYWACMGICMMSPDALAFIPDSGAFGLDQLAGVMLAAGHPPAVHPFEGLWLDLAGPEDYFRAAEILGQDTPCRPY